MDRLRPSGDGRVWALIAAYFLFLVVFGAAFHPVEEVDSAEWDNFVAKVDRIRAGHIPRDAYRPLLYSIVSAGVASLVGDSFEGARLTSSFFAALFVLSGFLIGRACFSSRAGWVAAAALAMNHHVIRHGVHATTDMMFAGLAGLTVAASVRATTSPRPSAMVVPAALFALACFTRYTALSLLPVLAVPLLVHPGRTWRSAARRAGVCTGVAAVLLLPHFVLTWKAFGSPFFTENWKNLAFKLHGDWEWERFHDPGEGGVLAVIAAAPGRFLELWMRELGKFVFRTLTDLGGYGLAGALFAAAALTGAYRALTGGNLAVRVTLLFVGAYVLFVTALFYTSPRFMLPILPMGYALAAHCLLSMDWGPAFRWRGFRMPRSAPVVGFFLVALGAASAREMPRFVAAHPLAELRALVSLEREFGRGIRVLGTSPHMQRHVGFDYRALDGPATRALLPSAGETEFAALVDGVDFVVIGRLTGRGVAGALLAGENPHESLDVHYRDGDVVVYRVRRASRGPGTVNPPESE